jgi:polyketide synthase PksJ
VYVITGGFGGIGLAAAQYLAREVKAKLVLIGRSAIPARETWDDYLSKAAADDAMAEKIQGLKELEETGAEVLPCQADVANEAEMEKAIAQARQRFGKINGVIHAAGIAGDGIIELKQREGADSVLQPKVQGCLILDKLMKDEELDFFVLCASLVGVLGSAGQVDYASGNAFMDAFAWSKRKAAKNRPISIDWDRWDDVGMAAKQIRELTAKQARLVDGKDEELSHPIFTRRIVGRDHETYMLRLSAKTHWVAGEHIIVGMPTMVGTSHLEHVRAAYSHSEGNDRVEIRDLIFIQPVMLKEDEQRDVYYTLKTARNGSREFAVWSVDNGTRLEHANGRLSPATDQASAKTYDAKQIFSRCGNERVPVMSEGVSTNGEPATVQLSKRWDIFERIADSDREAIAEINLSDVHLDDLSTYLMHPAVLDCATSYASGPIYRNMYLPIAYQKLRVLKAMTPKMYSYKQFKGTETGIPEVVSCDVSVFDESGEPIIEIEGFTVKRVPDPGALMRAGAAMTMPKKGASKSPPRFAPRISPAEGVEALRRIITGPWTPQVLVNVGDADIEVSIDQNAAAEKAEGGAGGEGTGQTYARPALGTPYVAPRSELESGLAEIWQAVLGIDKVGVHDDFIDLGGHSLLAIQLTSRISETFGIELPVAQFYQQPTVEGLAQAILLKLAEGMQDISLEELLEADTPSE